MALEMEEKRRKRMCLRDGYKGGGWRERLRGQSEYGRGQIHYMEIKCVWERVNKKARRENTATRETSQ